MRLPLVAAFFALMTTVGVAVGAEYRYSVQLGDPTKVIRTDRETGATVVCRNTAHGVWCPPSAEACRALLDKVQAWQAERDLPSQQQVIDCLQHNRCETKPPPKAPALPGTDEATLAWCRDHGDGSVP